MLVKSLRHLFHSVSYIFHRFNQAAACSQLLTKCLHVDIYGSVFHAVGTIPNSLVQPLARKNITGMFHLNFTRDLGVVRVKNIVRLTDKCQPDSFTFS